MVLTWLYFWACPKPTNSNLVLYSKKHYIAMHEAENVQWKSWINQSFNYVICNSETIQVAIFLKPNELEKLRHSINEF